MKKSERILLIGVTAVVLIVAGKFLVGRFITEPRKDAADKMARYDGDLMELEAEERMFKKMQRNWKKLGQKTISTDPNEAMLLLSSRMRVLLKRVGFSEYTVKNSNLSARGKRDRDWYWPVRVIVTAEGTLEQFVRFTELVYQEPYVVKISSVRLQSKSDSRRREPTNNRLDIKQMAITTIVLPTDGQSTPDFETLSAEELGNPETLPLPPINDRYAIISEKNILGPYQKPRVAIAPKPEPDPTPAPPQPKPEPQDPTPQPPPKVEPPVPSIMGVLVATTSYGYGQQAYVRSQMQPNDVRTFNVGDKLNGGTIVLVDSLGIVMERQPGQYVAVSKGGNVDSPEEFTASNFPELHYIFEQSLPQVEEPLSALPVDESLASESPAEDTPHEYTADDATGTSVATDTIDTTSADVSAEPVSTNTKDSAENATATDVTHTEVRQDNAADPGPDEQDSPADTTDTTTTDDQTDTAPAATTSSS